MSELRDRDRGRFRAAMELVDRLLDVPDAERDALLARECNDDALRAEVMKLLAADAEAGSFLSEPAGAKLPSAHVGIAAVQELEERLQHGAVVLRGGGERGDREAMLLEEQRLPREKPREEFATRALEDLEGD